MKHFRLLLQLGFLLAVSVAMGQSAPSTASTKIAGVVEQSGDTAFVRVLFHYDSGQWQPFAKPCDDEACLKTSAALYPPKTRWSLWQYDHASTAVTAIAPKTYTRYIDQGLLHVSPPSRKLSGGTLASSLPSLGDPDAWRQSKFATEDIRAVRAAFRQAFPKVMNCAKEGDEPSLAKPSDYTDSAIRMKSSLAAHTGWRLIQAVLANYRCDGMVEDAFAPQWFAISPSRQAVLLKPAGMWFVGAADLDGDGHSEIVFSSRDNGVAYSLFSPELKLLTSISFSAH